MKLCIPKDNYILRCVDESFGDSKTSGNPMITLEHEIVSPATVMIDGEETEVAGQTIKQYLTTKVLEGEDAEQKSKDCLANLEKNYNVFGLEFDKDTFNVDNPTLGFKGKTFHALLYGKGGPSTKAPTQEQIKQGKRVGDEIKNPITGKTVVQYQTQISEVYGLATQETGKAY